MLKTSTRVDDHSQIKVSIVVGVGCGFVYQNSKVTYGVRVNGQIEVLALIVLDSSLKIVLLPSNIARHVTEHNLVILIYFQIKFVYAYLVILLALHANVDPTDFVACCAIIVPCFFTHWVESHPVFIG